MALQLRPDGVYGSVRFKTYVSSIQLNPQTRTHVQTLGLMVGYTGVSGIEACPKLTLTAPRQNFQSYL